MRLPPGRLAASTPPARRWDANLAESYQRLDKDADGLRRRWFLPTITQGSLIMRSPCNKAIRIPNAYAAGRCMQCDAGGNLPLARSSKRGRNNRRRSRCESISPDTSDPWHQRCPLHLHVYRRWSPLNKFNRPGRSSARRSPPEPRKRRRERCSQRTSPTESSMTQMSTATLSIK